jgi:hypothetical protein
MYKRFYIITLMNNMQLKKTNPTVDTVPQFNRIMVELGKIYAPNTQIHDSSLSWLSKEKNVDTLLVTYLTYFNT